MTALNRLRRFALFGTIALPMALAGAALAQEKPKEHGDTPGAAYEPSMTTLARSRSRSPAAGRRPGHHAVGVPAGRTLSISSAAPAATACCARVHGPGADPGHHPGERLRVSQRLHHLRLAGRHAELGHLGSDDRGGSRHHGTLPADRAAGAAGVRHGRDAQDLEVMIAPGDRPTSKQNDIRHRQPVLGDAARRRSGPPSSTATATRSGP